jgi:hypothetical protein
MVGRAGLRRVAVAGEFQQIAPPLKNTRWKAISCRVEGGDPILATHTGGFPAEARQGMALFRGQGHTSVIGVLSWPLHPKEEEASMPKLRNGHAAGHVRETACDAFQAWMDWDGKSPEPTVEYKIHYVPHHISISRACGLVWNCTDTVPGSLFDDLQSNLEDVGQTIRRQTYGACAQAILSDSKQRVAVAA